MNTLIEKMLRNIRPWVLRLNYRNILLLVVLLISCLTAFLLGRFDLWLILISFIIFHRCIRDNLSNLVFNSASFKFLASFLIFTIIFQAIIILSWALDHEYPLSKTPYLVFIFTVLAASIRWLTAHRRHQVLPSERRTVFVNKHDIISLVTTLLILLVIIIPSIIASGADKTSSALQLINANIDDASHISIFNDHLDFNRGILHHTKDAPHLRSSTLYPASWHSLNVVGVVSVIPSISPGHESVLAYTVTKIFWFMVMIYMSLRVTLQLIMLFTKKEIPLLGLGCIVTIYLYFAQIFIHPFIEGFYSFIPQIIYTLLLLLLVTQLPRKRQQPDSEFAQYFSLLAIVAVGSTLPWFLPLPFFLLFLIATAIYYLEGSTWRKNIVFFLKNSMQYFHLYLVCGFAILLQYYVLTTDESSGAVSLVEGLTLNGGVTIYNLPFITMMTLGMSVFIASTQSTRTKTHLNVLIIFFTSSLLFISIVYLIQQIAIGANAYYYYKLLYLIIAATTPFTLAGIYLALIKLRERQGASLPILTVALVCLIINLIGIEPTTTQQSKYTYLSYFYGIRKLTPAHNETIYKNLAIVSTRHNYFDNTYYFFYNLHDLQIDTASFFLKSNKPGSVCFDRMRESFLNKESTVQIDKIAQKFCPTQKIYLIVSDGDKDEMSNMELNKVNPLTHHEAVKVADNRQVYN